MADDHQPDQVNLPNEPVEVDNLAVKEGEAFSTGKGFPTSFIKWEWGLKILFKVALFVFVIGVNIWWTYSVLKMIWKSGQTKADFHLNDTVLIALATTSLAAFLALVTVVAKHLFPSKSN
jgi:hypothetical protein